MVPWDCLTSQHIDGRTVFGQDIKRCRQFYQLNNDWCGPTEDLGHTLLRGEGSESKYRITGVVVEV